MQPADSSPQLNKIRELPRRFLALCLWVLKVFGNACYKFYWDDGFSRAAGLAYTTLFALVPVAALGVAMFPVFGLGKEQYAKLMRAFIEQMLPPMEGSQLADLQYQVITGLEQFVSNAQALNTVSIAALIFTSIALLNTIESALNIVWRVYSQTSIITRTIRFWFVISLGPLLIALSIIWTSKVQVFTGADPELISSFERTTGLIGPVLMTFVALTLLFYKVPSAIVPLPNAMFGAGIASVLFEFVKTGFTYYLSLSTTYSKLYGVLAAIPIFLFWLYVAWVVILLGAQLTYQAGSIHVLSARRKYATDLGEVGAVLGLRILAAIARSFARGETPPTESELSIEIGSDPVLVRSCLDILTDARILSVPDPNAHSRSLLISPDMLRVGDVYRNFVSAKIRPGLADDLAEEARILEAVRALSLTPLGGRSVTAWTLTELAGAIVS